MDIALLSGMVADLILYNDLVCVKGLGTFRATVMPAVFSDKGFTINPPYRKLEFTSQQTPCTLLAEAYARANCTTVAQAEAVIEALSREIKEELASVGYVEFEGLGVLKRTSSGEDLFFVADPDLDIFPDGFGLNPVSLRSRAAVSQAPAPVSVRQEAPVPETKAAETAPDTRKHRRVRTIVLAVLVGILVVALAYMLLARFAPDVIDRILYTQEEYNLIHSEIF